MEEAAPSNQTLTLNDLPEEILLRILTFLPTLDSVKTSCISRKWRPLWSRVPSLDFRHDLFPPFTSDQDFAEFVDRVLIRRRSDSPIDTFRLHFIYHSKYRYHVDSWAHSAVAHLCARRLHLELKDCHGLEALNHRYDFPFFVLSNGSVETLTLMNCNLTMPVKLSTMCFPSIGSLKFQQVFLTDKMIGNLILGCPNLETLEVHNPGGHHHLKICSTRLKKLALTRLFGLEDEYTLLVDCPNLCSFSFDCSRFETIWLKNASSLVEFRIYVMHSVRHFYGWWSSVAKTLEQAPNIKHLHAQNWWFKFLTSKDSLPESFMLHNLNLLELKTGFTQYDLVGMAALLKLCPNLETLILQYLLKFVEDENLPEEVLNKPVEFSIPRLKRVIMTSYTGAEDEDNFRRILIKQGVALTEIVLFPGEVGKDVQAGEKELGENSVSQVVVYRKASQGWKKYSRGLSSTTADSMDTVSDSEL